MSLKAFSPLRSPQIHAAFLAALTSFFVLFGYECLRSASYVLVKFTFGVEKLPYFLGSIPIVSIGLLGFYNFVLVRLRPRRTLVATMLFSLVFFVICYALLKAGVDAVSGPLFIFRELYIVLIIEQLWSFINSTIDTQVAKKINGWIIGLSTMGAILGGFTVGRYAEIMGTETLLLFGALSLIPSAFMADYFYKKFGEPGIDKEDKPGTLGIKELSRYRNLIIIFVAVVVSQAVATLLDLVFQSRLQEAIPLADKQTSFSGYFFMFLNLGSLVSQFVLTPFLLGRFPLKFNLVMVPAINLGLCVFAFLTPGMTFVALAYFMFKVMDYSLFRASKEILYIPYPYAVRYQTKEFIDIFGYRGSKGLTSVAVGIIQKSALAGEALILKIAIAGAGLWLMASMMFRSDEVVAEKDL